MRYSEENIRKDKFNILNGTLFEIIPFRGQDRGQIIMGRYANLDYAISIALTLLKNDPSINEVKINNGQEWLRTICQKERK